MNVPISDTAIQAIADAIFKERPSTVVESYSGPSQELCTFHTPLDLCTYANAKRSSRDGAVHIAVHYPDMAGRIARTRVALNPSKCDGHTYRYRADGWGLIRVYLQLHPKTRESFVSANSETRANAWAATLPELDAPATWDWPAVARHLRRLRRALKLAA